MIWTCQAGCAGAIVAPNRRTKERTDVYKGHNQDRREKEGDTEKTACLSLVLGREAIRVRGKWSSFGSLFLSTAKRILPVCTDGW